MRKAAIQFAIILTMVSPAFAQAPTSSVSYATPDRGGVHLETPGGTNPVVIGYAQVQPVSGTTPAGLTIFGLRQNGVLVTEAGIPGTTPTLSGRTYAEVNGTINTGIAITNPNSVTVNISFTFVDQTGNITLQGTFIVGANMQTAKFLSDSPFRLSAFVGTFTFTASAPVAVIVVRTRINERGEFLVTTQSVTSLPDTFSASPVVLAHFASGAGWTTELLLVNTSDASVTGTVQFFDEGSATVAGAPITLSVNGQTASSFTYSIRPRSSTKLETSAASNSTMQVGSVIITPDAGSITPSPLAIFSYSPNGVTISSTNIQTQPQGTAFRSYVEANSKVAFRGAIRSAIAIANTSATSATVNFELKSLDGLSAGENASLVVPAKGHAAKFLTDLFPTMSLPFRGILRVSSSNQIELLSVRARYNERGEVLFAATPPTNETSQSSTASLIFPEIVDQGGWATEFILFSGISGQSTTGTLNFFGQDGQPLNLTVR